MQDDELLIEKKYLALVVEFIKKKISEIHGSIDIQKTEADNMVEYINTQKIDNIEIAQNQYEIIFSDHKQKRHHGNIKKYQGVLGKPFFAKIEIVESGNKEEYYIGLIGIGDASTNYVIDWRAPISSLFYYSDVGKAKYSSPQGEIKVTLTKKRQFIIESGDIKYYFDTDTTLDNEILQLLINKNTSDYMSNIVPTIQKEQNKIIRENPDRSVIINGVAGSGKTSIAIHRIAYLLYIKQGKLKSENMINVSPNRLFSAYISQLLPELGEENIMTLTSIELFHQFNLLPNKYGTKGEMYEAILNGDDGRLEKIRSKMSYEYYTKLCDYLIQLNNYKLFAGLTFQDIEIDETLAQKFYLSHKSSFNIHYCIKRTAEQIANHYFRGRTEKYIESAAGKIMKFVIKRINILNVFHDFMKSDGESTPSGKIKYEDISTYVFINLFIKGAKISNDILHLFIDEMQDYDALTFTILKELYPKSIFTIVGDFQQSLIYSKLSLDMIHDLFPFSEKHQLLISYRSTIQIIQFANSVLKKETKQNVIRNGKPPEVRRISGDEELCAAVNAILEDAKVNHYKIGMLVKNIEEANNMHKLFPDWNVITEENQISALATRTVITTIYISKGLEFDVVIIPNLGKSNFCKDIDRHYLYIAITRALHEFYGFYQNDISEFIT